MLTNKCFQALTLLRSVVLALPLCLLAITGCSSSSGSGMSATTNAGSPADEENTLMSDNAAADSTVTNTETDTTNGESDENTDSEPTGEGDTAQSDQEDDTNEGEDNGGDSADSDQNVDSSEGEDNDSADSDQDVDTSKGEDNDSANSDQEVDTNEGEGNGNDSADSGQEDDTNEGEDNGTGSVDSDGDLLTDQQEIALGTDPFIPDSNDDGKKDGDEDLDSDGVGNYVEYAVGSSPIEFDEPRFVYTQRALVIFSGDSAVLTEDGVDDFNGWVFTEYFAALQEAEDVNRQVSLTLRGESVSEALATERANYLSDQIRSILSFQTIDVIVIPSLVNTDAPTDVGPFDERVRIEWVVTSEGGDVGSSITGYTGFVGDD